MEQFERIRRDAREGASIRELARRHKVHRRTVRQALADATPPPRKPAEREAVAFGRYEPIVRDWLTQDLEAPRKQRHTARRVWQRLVDEHGAELAESTVRPHVARLKVEVGLAKREVMVPQSHPEGEEAEVDFGQFEASIAGVVLRLWMFVMRLSHSGKAVHIAYANEAQESFLDGHVKAFEVLGGVPTKMIRYDNLKPAVLKCLLGRERFENPKFVALRSHYPLTELRHAFVQVSGLFGACCSSVGDRDRGRDDGRGSRRAGAPFGGSARADRGSLAALPAA